MWMLNYRFLSQSFYVWYMPMINKEGSFPGGVMNIFELTLNDMKYRSFMIQNKFAAETQAITQGKM